MGYLKKINLWVPYELTKVYLAQCIIICDLFLKRNKNAPFLKRLITGDEKLVLYSNVNNGNNRGENQKKTCKHHIHQKNYNISLMGLQRTYLP